MAQPTKQMKELAKQIGGDKSEPKDFTTSKMGLINGLNFYSSRYELKDSKIWSLAWLKENDPATAKHLANAKDWQFKNYGFVCRMITKGFNADSVLLARLHAFFNTLVPETESRSTEYVPSAPKKHVIKGLNINHSMSSLDEQMDNACTGKPITPFQFSHTKKSELDVVENYCRNLLKDFNDHREDYLLKTIHALRPILKNAIVEVEKLKAHIEKNKTAVAASAPKKINAASMVRTVKYQVKDDALGIRSVPLTSVVGAKKLYVYDTAKRRLMLYVCTNASGLMFSGTTIKNYDPTKSTGKTIRKPEAFFAQFKDGMTLSLLNTGYAGIAGKATPVLTGRTNETLIFLKVSE